MAENATYDSSEEQKIQDDTPPRPPKPPKIPSRLLRGYPYGSRDKGNNRVTFAQGSRFKSVKRAPSVGGKHILLHQTSSDSDFVCT